MMREAGLPIKEISACASSYHAGMARTDLYLKITIEHDEDEHPERLAAEICRSAAKTYGVRKAELTSFVTRGDDAASS